MPAFRKNDSTPLDEFFFCTAGQEGKRVEQGDAHVLPFRLRFSLFAGEKARSSRKQRPIAALLAKPCLTNRMGPSIASAGHVDDAR